MIVYSVSVMIKNTILDDWLNWMKNEHIPEVMATGYFLNYKILKTLIPSEDADERVFIIQYTLNSIEDYYNYAEKFSPTLQRKFQEKFSGKFTANRTVLELIDSDI